MVAGGETEGAKPTDEREALRGERPQGWVAEDGVVTAGAREGAFRSFPESVAANAKVGKSKKEFGGRGVE
jgi:hypothetical protein